MQAKTLASQEASSSFHMTVGSSLRLVGMMRAMICREISIHTSSTFKSSGTRCYQGYMDCLQ